MIWLKTSLPNSSVPMRCCQLEWAKRCPNPLQGDAEIEIRQVHEAADFGDALTPELREAEKRMAAQMAANARP